MDVLVVEVVVVVVVVFGLCYATCRHLLCARLRGIGLCGLLRRDDIFNCLNDTGLGVALNRLSVIKVKSEPSGHENARARVIL